MVVTYEVYNNRGLLIDHFGRGRFAEALDLKRRLGEGAGIEMVLRKTGSRDPERKRLAV